MNASSLCLHQSYRRKALKAQLAALEAQSIVFHEMSLEHGYDLSATDVRTLVSQAKDLVESAETLTQRLATETGETARREVSLFRANALMLMNNADRLERQRETEAALRLDLSGSHTPTGDELPDPRAVLPVDEQHLVEEAEKSCFFAEIDQSKTFALQLHALCKLSEEYVICAVQLAICHPRPGPQIADVSWPELM